MSRTVIYFHVYILIDFSIIYRNASVLVNQNVYAYIKQ